MAASWQHLKKKARQTSQRLVEKVGCGHTTVVKGLIHSFKAWVLHKLPESNKESQPYTGRYQASRGYNDWFSHRIVTGNRKWCLQINMNRSSERVAPEGKRRLRVQTFIQRGYGLHLASDLLGITFYESDDWSARLVSSVAWSQPGYLKDQTCNWNQVILSFVTRQISQELLW